MPNYFIFRSSEDTHQECIERMLVGQRDNMKKYVAQVKPGDVIFIHKTSSMMNIDSQFIEGPFFAVSECKAKLVPEAWKGDFPLQVKIERRGKTSRINQQSFKEFQLNYSFAKIYFDFQVDSLLGRKLMEEMGLEVDVVQNIVINYNPLENADIDIRLRYPAKYRCNDGHYVRSKNEVIVDNWLFEKNIAHGYEKKITGQNMLCDFFIRNKHGESIYIEIWGLNDEKYLKRKKDKEIIYNNNNLKLISITEKEVQNIDDYISEQLKKCNCL